MRRALLYSSALHVAAIAMAIFGLPVLFRPPPDISEPIAVDLVLDQPAKAKPKPKPHPKPIPRRAERPPPAPDIPPPPPQTALAEPEPPPPPPQKKPAPKPKPVVAPKPKPAAVFAPRPRPRPTPPKKKVKPKPKPDKFQALLKNLARERQRREADAKQAAKVAEPAPVRQQTAPARSAIERRQLEQALIVAVRQQLSPCWNVPAGAKDAQEMQVSVRIRLNPDGTLRGAPVVLDESRVRADPFYRAVAESAVRALLNPRCSPLKLPFDQYDIWKDITFNFEPLGS